MKISIIIPSLNSGKFIETAIVSVIGQGYKDVECLVMDGQSTDNTLEVLQKYNGRIRWVSEKDKGSCPAFNKGMELATGEVVSSLCADDILRPNSLQNLAECFSNPQVMWAYGKCDVIDGKGRQMHGYVTRYRTFWQKRYSYITLMILDYLAAPAVFWRKSAFVELGGWRNEVGADYEYWLRLGEKYRPAFIDEWLASFRWHDGGHSKFTYAEDAKLALNISKEYARKTGKQYLIPLQYLNYLSVVWGYKILG